MCVCYFICETVMYRIGLSPFLWGGGKMRMCGSADVATCKMGTNIADIICGCDG